MHCFYAICKKSGAFPKPVNERGILKKAIKARGSLGMACFIEVKCGVDVVVDPGDESFDVVDLDRVSYRVDLCCLRK